MSFSNEIGQKIIHHSLEGCRRITKSEVHDFSLEEATVCYERSLPFITLFDPYIVVTPSKINLGKDRRLTQ